jgi:carbon monoxide dehydrogenase subunit G
MATFTVTTFINRPPQEVFDFMTDPANQAKWQSGTESAEWSSEGSVGVGSTVHSVGRLLGREMDLNAEITQWNPPDSYSLKAESGPMNVEATSKFESKDGGTLLIQDFEGEIGGFFKLAEGLAIKQVQKQVETDGNALKMLLEAG